MTQLNAFLQQSIYGAQQLRAGLTIDCGWIEGTSIRPLRTEWGSSDRVEDRRVIINPA
jgi:hypothetical protein